MKNILNVIADMLTLLAVCLAALGHVLPWFDRNRMAFFRGPQNIDFQELTVFQRSYSVWSGTALGILALLVCVSLLFSWGPAVRRFLNLGMFASAFVALLFELMVFSGYPSPGDQRHLQLHDTEGGYLLAMVPTCCAVFFSLVRMLWTMPPIRPALPQSPAELDKLGPLEIEPRGTGIIERRS